MKSIRVIQYGLGPIGCNTARAIMEKKGLELVGAIDIAPDKAGKDLGEVLGLSDKLKIPVSADAAQLFRKTKAHVVAHTTQSSFKVVYGQLETAAIAGLCVVSSTEELLVPSLRNPELASKLDRLARKQGVAMLGTGVNPGFVMDTLALVLTGVCTKVRGIKITRRVDASTRRMPLQRKVGAGMTAAEFRKLVRQGKLGHVGLLESMYLVAAGLGWEITRHQEKIEPVLAEATQTTAYFTVQPGDVCGIKHTCSGISHGRKVLDLDLQMYLGAPEPQDSVEIDGEPPIKMIIHGGVAGDIATVASLVNAIPLILNVSPGLKTMLDMPILRAFQAV